MNSRFIVLSIMLFRKWVVSNCKHLKMLRNDESKMRLSQQGQGQHVKAPPVKTPAFGSNLHKAGEELWTP